MTQTKFPCAPALAGTLIASMLVGALMMYSEISYADVWRWTDANGDVHFVDTEIPIYTWVDEVGNVWFSDTPDHEDAVSVMLVWHSPAESVEEAVAEYESTMASNDPEFANESPAEREQREQAEAYYCMRAQEIYASYQQAPRLYRTDETGERVYLSDEEAAATMLATKTKMDSLCQ